MVRSKIVHDFAPNFALPRFPRYSFAAARFLSRSWCLLFFGCLMGGAGRCAEVPSAPADSVGPSLSFSIADFDGDLKPDLASVQAGRTDVSRTDYWIQLQLSEAGRQTFQIAAPMGGLQIAARDVNGDHALDLVLTTTWLGQPVAILLNDGHGSFSRVDPTAFPEAFSESKTSWGSVADQATDAVGIPPQSRGELCLEAKNYLHVRSQDGFIVFSDLRPGISPFLISHLGRAPPFELPQL
jgi:hypothetical protein